MRLHPAFHVAGVAAFVLFFVYFISRTLKTILDTSPYMLSKEELSLDNYTSKPHYEIPKIIHQVYLGWDNKPMPDSWAQSRQSCIDMNPEFEHKLWDNVTARNLIEEQYPWFLSTYDNYKFPIQRADSIRYFILWHYGGIYIDLDNGCRRNLDPLRIFPAWMPTTKKSLGLTNHIMGTKRKHPYFLLLINSLQSYDHDWLLPYLTIMNSAGPHFVSMVWEEYVRDSGPKEEVRILMQDEMIGNDWSFFTKEEGGSWHHWDTELFSWAARHLIIIGILCLAALFGVVSFFWYLGWRLALLLERKFTTDSHSQPLLPWDKSD